MISRRSRAAWVAFALALAVFALAASAWQKAKPIAVSNPPHVIEPPDILLITVGEPIPRPAQSIAGIHVVRPDGSICLGVYGPAFVAGMTLPEAAEAVATRLQAAEAAKGLAREQLAKGIRVKVDSYDDKVCYVISPFNDWTERAAKVPLVGGETVLDAISKVEGLVTIVPKSQIWIVRPGAPGSEPQTLSVDFKAITELGKTETDYSIQPGDRIYVRPEPASYDRHPRLLSPAERLWLHLQFWWMCHSISPASERPAESQQGKGDRARPGPRW
jgi:protein involved in polysaccharide export with SLBB domain